MVALILYRLSVTPCTSRGDITASAWHCTSLLIVNGREVDLHRLFRAF